MSCSKVKKREVTTPQRQQDIINLAESLYSLIRQGEMQPCNVVERVAEMLKISRSTVLRYYKTNIGEAATPCKKRKKTQQELISIETIDDFTVGAIRSIIYRMYREGHHITLATLLKEIQESDLDFYGKRTQLYHLMHNIGFVWRNFDGRKAMLEDDNIKIQRRFFLRRYMEEKAKGTNLIFFDETWIFAKGTVPKTWQDDTVHTAKRRCVGEGKRFVVVHAGGCNGFVLGAGLLFVAGQAKGDYHGEMKGDTFQKWMKNLLECLQEPSVIVMDNASYHSTQLEKFPNSSWRKDAIINWLQEHIIPFASTALKAELVGVAKANWPPKRYVIDEMAREMNHHVLRLPPYHCHYNAIELVWAQAKKHYKSHMGRGRKFDNVAVETIWKESLDVVTPERWSKCVDHVEKIIAEAWHSEVHQDIEEMAPFIIPLGSDLDTTDEEDAGGDDGDVLAVTLGEVPGCSTW